MKVFFDFETRSTSDLKKEGAYKYAFDPSTDVVCLAYAIDDGPVKIYRHLDGDKAPLELFDIVLNNPDAEFIAHNVTFDWLIWNAVCSAKYKWPRLPIEKAHCTMAMAYAMGLQGSLENAAKDVGLKIQKDAKGGRVMLQLAKPRSVDEQGNVTWWKREDSKPNLDINEKYDMTYKYCMQDINVMRELYKRLLPLSPRERQVWLLDNKINSRGVYIDTEAAKRAIKLAEFEKDYLNKKIQDLSDNVISSCNSHVRFREWVNAKGVETDSLDKAAMNDLLETDLPDIVREALKIKQAASKSSVAKLGKMISTNRSNGRSSGMFQYHGAASTGRWAGRIIQLQNLPRPKIKQREIEKVFDILMEIEL